MRGDLVVQPIKPLGDLAEPGRALLSALRVELFELRGQLRQLGGGLASAGVESRFELRYGGAKLRGVPGWFLDGSRFERGDFVLKRANRVDQSPLTVRVGGGLRRSDRPAEADRGR